MSKNQSDDPRSATAVDRKIGALIRARRLELGMSQTTLADAVGVTFQQIQKYEKGVNRVAASTLIDIAMRLDVRVPALLPSGKSDDPAETEADEAREAVELLLRLNDEGRRVVAVMARSLANDARYKTTRRRREE